MKGSHKQITIAIPSFAHSGLQYVKSAWTKTKPFRDGWRSRKSEWKKEGPFYDPFSLKLTIGLASAGALIEGVYEARKEQTRFNYDESDRAYDVAWGMGVGACSGALSGLIWPYVPYVIGIIAMHRVLMSVTRRKNVSDKN